MTSESELLKFFDRQKPSSLEERKESTQFLRAHGISGKDYRELNEHSTADDLRDLVKLCEADDTALITDCGTPGFCDPGADLVRLCREKGIPVFSVPGPSSLMGLLSLSSRRIDQFVFRGFLSAESETRAKQWQELKREKRAVVLMDTPYRLEKMMTELCENFGDRTILLTLNLTQSTEQILEGRPEAVKRQIREKKAEFMVLVYSS